MVSGSETGKGRQPNKGFLTKEATTAGIGSLTPWGTLRSGAEQALGVTQLRRCGERTYLCASAHHFLSEGCSERGLIFTALLARRVHFSGQRKTKGTDSPMLSPESQAGIYKYGNVYRGYPFAQVLPESDVGPGWVGPCESNQLTNQEYAVSPVVVSAVQCARRGGQDHHRQHAGGGR